MPNASLPTPSESGPTTVNPDPPGAPAGRGRRHWCLAFVAFFLIIFAWSMATPYDGTPDEKEHIIRAAGVAAGQIAPPPAEAKAGTGAFQTVPGGLVRAQCWQFKPQVSAACAVPPGSDRTPTRAGTGAGRYYPAYYLLVGGPVALWPGWPGVLLSRALSALMSAALLACAFMVIRNRSRRGLMMAALLAVTTPMAMHMASAVNPNGLEIAAGIAFFSGIIPLMLGPAGAPRRGLILLVGVSALLLTVLRQTGPLWVVAAFVAFAFPLRRGNLVGLLRERAARWWVVALVLSTLSAVVWTVVQKASDLGHYSQTNLSRGQATLIEADRWRGYVEQIIGLTSWLDTRMPAPPYLIWQFFAGALLVLAVVWCGWLDRWRLVVLLGAGVLLPSAIQVAFIKSSGFVTQGRYMLPMLVGVLLFAAYAVEERGFDMVRARTFTRLAVLLLLPIHLFCLVFTMVRWQHGLPSVPGLRDLNPFAGDWHPVVGSATPLLAATAGLALFGWLAWTARFPAGPQDAERDGTAAATRPVDGAVQPLLPAAGA